MKLFTAVLLGLFVFGVSSSVAQDEISEPENKDAPTEVPPTTTSTVPAPVPDDKNTTTSSTTTTSTTPETTTPATTTTEKPTTTPPTTTTIPTTTTTVKTSTTSTTPTTTSTTAPNTTVPPTPQPSPPHPNHWSTTSFIGGMVFAFGMGAIGFVAWKFYKARNERNYHTL